jgi:hypothetical protein
MIYPMATDDNVASTIARFQTEVKLAVRQDLKGAESCPSAT